MCLVARNIRRAYASQSDVRVSIKRFCSIDVVGLASFGLAFLQPLSSEWSCR